MTAFSAQPLQGMSDIREPAVLRWQRLERLGIRVLEDYGCAEIRTPILERTDLFARGIGDATDVVQKEMYRFEDRGGRDVSLRPEGTAGVIRAVAAAGQDLLDARLYYLGPMFRSERPQAGRRRQFHQLGAELLGAPNAAADAECIALQLHILAAWGVTGARLRINTRGVPEDREPVADGLRARLEPVRDRLCPDCRRRMDTNILRVLDCKQAACAAEVSRLPPMTDFMSAASRDYLAEVDEMLSLLGIEAERSPRLVRGLDYYVHTVWEISHDALGAQDALCGGGRYRFELGRHGVDGVGFALGLERVLMVLEAVGGGDEAPPSVRVCIVTQDPCAFRENLVLAQTLRRKGVPCVMDLRADRPFKKQLRAADRMGAAWTVIRGRREMDQGTFLLKDMADGHQQELTMPELMARLTVSIDLG
jgi:histidyl-tRNA synthetase